MADEQDLRQTVQQATEGNPVAMDALFGRYLPQVRRYLARQAGQLIQAKESVSDLAQSVCREALEQLADGRFDYRGEAEFKQWLYKAAEHKIQNRHRFYAAKKRDAGREVAKTAGSGADAGELARTVTTPSGQVMRADQRRELDEHIEKLPQKQRQVVRMFYLEQLSHKQIAQELGVSETHSRVLLVRAMAQLARLGMASESESDGD